MSHLTKHKDDKDGGAEAWAPDPQDTSLEWGGEEPPNTYADYLKKCARRDAWIDGYMLRALSQRLGIPIIVWFLSSNGVWLRHVVAPWFHQGYAQTTKDKAPVVVAPEG